MNWLVCWFEGCWVGDMAECRIIVGWWLVDWLEE
jgi:hypothetical protein